MLIGPDFSRELRRGEEDAVDALLRSAFDGPDEAELVHALRRAGAMAGESVATWDGRIAGYYALSHMVAPKGWLCLAPVAVSPDRQRHGLGRRMIGMLAEWARLSETYVVVLGQVSFYERAGFSLARAQRLNSPYPLEHTMIAGPGADVPAVALKYPKAFG
ncbi:GNAT family N-acetyltransferase [Pseudosulfitobacter pseudonitzschiae]|uniref:GNAT family N-acetyltransferase n=1 Tax=Pseudosulfitobacter pseudonitzschiae TaxID=1402135 RepID=UPI001AF133F5|nr:N-acetyltransferase [Pseudosulfitobacter pseudonitzschiae]MBM1814120.1 N-acetyltransferase [Pseudosulfitobacter pseudonitzschiae]MBM1831113.1 N-acetyltransferase [Pseudosulfitobacter pseudonitzschiae]MBM1835980.1 N-acetyltransferase [Pseudosulfitobacter pseudonitzschiae]MBM1840826.1 N-acetyltransferase [Pseudosulfitobacter pseudonitzschiae]MBM1845186.1 N-acetyltransferase [Pseudosulfitobacter pseudonitzschiae]